MKVYYMNVKKINPDDKKWYKYLTEKRIEKVERLKKPLHKAQSIGAELLIKRAVQDKKGKDASYLWDTDEDGKLYLCAYNDFYVNVSHSGDYAVCAADDKPVGVDIQHCRECDMKIANRFFTEREALYIQESADIKKAFFEIWTKKESFVKAVGKGLKVPLNSFSVLGDTVNYEGVTYKFSKYTVGDGDYKLFVCSPSEL